MLKSLTMRATLTCSALAAIAGLAIVSQSSTASARQMLSCDGASRQSVVECCERQVLKRGLPVWMRQTGANCQKMVVKCTGGSSTISHATSKRKCVVVYDHQSESRGKNFGKRGGGNSNGPNGSSTGGKN